MPRQQLRAEIERGCRRSHRRQQHSPAPRRRRRSTARPFVAEIVNCGLEANSASGPLSDASNHLTHRWRLGDPREFRSQVLLKRLPRFLSATLQVRVDIGWQISDQNVWHACIMLARIADRKRSPLVMGQRRLPASRGRRVRSLRRLASRDRACRLASGTFPCSSGSGASTWLAEP